MPSVTVKYQKLASTDKRATRMIGDTDHYTKSRVNNNKLKKYYSQRYNLFSRFDDGIQMDDEAWFSVTPENIAKHISDRMHQSLGEGHILILDGFCGVGGNLIQFALSSPYVRVVGVDNNPGRIEMAKHNAKIYGVQHQCEFILGDFMELMPTFQTARVDAVFLSPPWGGIDYLNTKKYSLNSMTPNGFEIVQLCRRYITNNIAFLMPRNIDIAEVNDRLLSKDHTLLECEQNMVGKKIKTITMYFGALVKSDDDDDDDDDVDNSKNVTTDKNHVDPETGINLSILTNSGDFTTL